MRRGVAMIALSASASASTAFPANSSRRTSATAAGPAGIQAIALLAGPDRVFIELKPLVGDAAEHHRAEPPVADRQRLVPVRRGLAIPEPEILAGGAFAHAIDRLTSA